MWVDTEVLRGSDADHRMTAASGRKRMKSNAAAEADYQSLVLSYTRSSDQDAPRAVRHPVIVVGAGPVGLSAAIDLAQQGVPALLLDDDDRLSSGSRAICFAKRTLEIFDRLGCGQRMVDKGVTWNLGKVFFHDEPVYSFNLLPEARHQRPPSSISSSTTLRDTCWIAHSSCPTWRSVGRTRL